MHDNRTCPLPRFGAAGVLLRSSGLPAACSDAVVPDRVHTSRGAADGLTGSGRADAVAGVFLDGAHAGAAPERAGTTHDTPPDLNSVQRCYISGASRCTLADQVGSCVMIAIFLAMAVLA